MTTVERVLAPNPGPYTGPGTNTYVIESAGQAVILDPGPIIAGHIAAIRVALTGFQPVGVVVTHTHPDHAPAANGLGRELNVPVYGFAAGDGFEPTERVEDGAAIAFGDGRLVAVHTPGHTSDHLCFRLGGFLFTGDHIMGGSTVIIEDAAGLGYVGENSDLIVTLDGALQSDPLGFIYPLGSDLVGPVNEALAVMKEDGTLEELGRKYFTDAFTVTYDDLDG